MAIRKRWKTLSLKNGIAVRTGAEKTYRSKKAAYERVTGDRRGYYVRRGNYAIDAIKVYIDEGNGWELYETIDFTTTALED